MPLGRRPQTSVEASITRVNSSGADGGHRLALVVRTTVELARRDHTPEESRGRNGNSRQEENGQVVAPKMPVELQRSWDHKPSWMVQDGRVKEKAKAKLKAKAKVKVKAKVLRTLTALDVASRGILLRNAGMP